MLFDGLLIEHQCRLRAVAAASSSGRLVYRNPFLSSLLGLPNPVLFGSNLCALPGLLALIGNLAVERQSIARETELLANWPEFRGKLLTACSTALLLPKQFHTQPVSQIINFSRGTGVY
jgi:hypothetical protein